VPKRTVDKRRRDKLLAKVPDGATRVQVKTEMGQIKYKEIADLADKDEIQTKKDGTPIVMLTKPGRKKDVTLDPATPEVAEKIRRKNEIIDTDSILEVARDNPESPDVLQQILLALGEEAASIGFERQEAERQGQETSLISNRRIAALKAIGDTWLKRKEQISARGVDMESPAFKVLFEFIMNTFRGALEDSGLAGEMVETVFAKLASSLNDEGWEAEAKRRMKSIV